MAKRIKNKPLTKWKSPNPTAREGCLRIVGGRYRGRQIAYSGDPRTRPMKDNVREALFNLVGAYVPGKTILDLFAGTGAIGLEGLSRGARHAVMLERHIPTAKLIQANSRTLGVESDTTVISSDTFFWVREFKRAWNSADASARTHLPLQSDQPWGVFCCPPYAFYDERTEEMLDVIDCFLQAAPAGSFIVCETDSRFRLRALPDYENWRIKHYSPAVLCVYFVPAHEADSATHDPGTAGMSPDA